VTRTPDLTAWTPIAVSFRGGEPVIRWCFTGGIEFTEPMFDQTIDRALQHPFRLLFWRETGLAALAEHARDHPGLAPAGFVFHMSRCGSTLVAQMLAALPDALVISEPGPLDTLTRSGGATPVDLQAMVSALGQPRTAAQQRLVIKLDAWAVLQLPLIRRAFPETPFVFLYRDPVEVIVSHLNRRGYHTIPGTIAGVPIDSRPEQYIAAVLGHLLDAAVAATRTGDLVLINYEQLPAAVPETLAPRFDLRPDAALLANAAKRNAKNPFLEFAPDGDAKRSTAGAEIRDAAARHVAPAYLELERIRTA
jgi:hypothetical protein